MKSSIKNIFIELYNDIGIKPASSGCLERWSKQGILLLNTCLTVEKGKPSSHRNIGWEQFTDSVLKQLNANKKNVVYLLWGKHAQEKAHIINKSYNKVFMSSHPSPYSANQGFFGSKPFSISSKLLKSSSSFDSVTLAQVFAIKTPSLVNEIYAIGPFAEFLCLLT